MFSASTKSAHPSSSVNWIDDVFSTWLYTGNGSSTTVVNGIDTSTKGGLIWVKKRSGVQFNILQDTARGAGYLLYSNATTASGYDALSATTFTTDGFTTGSDNNVNASGSTYASWTFRKQAKFFDVVTWTGNNNSSRTISHNLGSTPGFILIKNTTTAEDWVAWHKDAPNGWTGALNLSDEFIRSDNNCNNVTSTTFTTNKNNSPEQYVAYLFAHNAGGFGTAGTDNVISCGSFADSAGVTVNLGYEPQWVLIKSINSVSDWYLLDNMRGFDNSGMNRLEPNSSSAEIRETPAYYVPTATGFKDAGGWLSGSNCIYIAIRRPMKPPTSGTEVFQSLTRTGTGALATVTNSNINYVDFAFSKMTSNTAAAAEVDRLRGNGYLLFPAYTSAQTYPTGYPKLDLMNGYQTDSIQNFNQNSFSFVNYLFKRASTFFDIVRYTGTGTAGQTFNHNLGVVPELMIVKRTNTNGHSWYVYHSFLGATKNLTLNTLNAEATATNIWNDTSPTSTLFTVGNSSSINASTAFYVNYLFATVAGVSKVGSYTGTGGTQTIDCGFGASGARFVLIKRTDSTGNWYYFDTSRGFTSSSSPYLIMNNDNTQVTGDNGCYASSTGFNLTSASNATVNINGASYIYLAIA